MQSQPDNIVAPSKPASTRRFYNPALDGLRFFAFFAVFLFHAFFERSPAGAAPPVVSSVGWHSWVVAARSAGMFGVDLFFVLSSFLITRLLLIEKETRGKVDIRAFYARRILRIWPLYYAFLLYILVTQWAGMPKTPVLAWFGFLFFFVNWIATVQGSFNQRGSMLWTVSIEEQFYATWPWIVSRVSRLQLIRICAGLITFAMVLRVVLTLFHASWGAIQFNTLARLDPLAMGAILAASPRIEKWFASLRWPLLYPPLCAFGIIVVLFVDSLQVIPRVVTAPATIFLIGLCCTFAVGCMLRPDSANLKVVAWPPIVYLGRISYGLYVYHATVIGIAFRIQSRFDVPGGHWVVVPLELALTICVASLSYKFLEQPFLSLKERFARVLSRPGG